MSRCSSGFRLLLGLGVVQGFVLRFRVPLFEGQLGVPDA